MANSRWRCTSYAALRVSVPALISFFGICSCSSDGEGDAMPAAGAPEPGAPAQNEPPRDNGMGSTPAPEGPGGEPAPTNPSEGDPGALR
jgi:hypothetical protein